METPEQDVYEDRLVRLLEHLRHAGEEVVAILALPANGYSLPEDGDDAWPELRETLTHLHWQTVLAMAAVAGICPLRLRQRAKVG